MSKSTQVMSMKDLTIQLGSKEVLKKVRRRSVSGGRIIILVDKGLVEINALAYAFESGLPSK